MSQNPPQADERGRVMSASIGPTCPDCRHVHAANDAIAVFRFTGHPSYRAATAPTPPRATRAEAEADECRWRQARVAPTVPAVEPVARPVPVDPPPPPEPELFPAELMEQAARAKAWGRFLSEVSFSLQVWQLDPGVRKGEHVIAWLRQCRDDLNAFIGKAGATEDVA